MSKKKEGRESDDDLCSRLATFIFETNAGHGPEVSPESVRHFGGEAHLTPTREEYGL